MPAAEHANSTTLSIIGTTIRQDAEGRFCLNDCHRAAGSPGGKGPNEWAKNAQTDALIAELRSGGIPLDPKKTVTTSPNEGRGTYVAKELVYAYAMWISPAFHLQVIRAFDALVRGAAAAEPAPAPVGHPDPAAIRQPVGLFRSFQYLHRQTGQDRNQAALSANARVRDMTGIDLLRVSGATHLTTAETDHLLTPEAIGQRIGGRSARAVNEALAAIGFQRKVSLGRANGWAPTPDGQPHAVMLDTGKRHSDGAPVRQLKWRTSVVSFVATHMTGLLGQPAAARPV